MMKDFEFDSNRNTENGENSFSAPINDSENTQVGMSPAEQENSIPEKIAEDTPKAPESLPGTDNDAPQPRPISENPYFSGFSQPAQNIPNPGAAQSSQNPQNPQNPRTTPYNSGMREYPYGSQQNPNAYRPDSARPQSTNPGGGYHPNNHQNYNQPLNNQPLNNQSLNNQQPNNQTQNGYYRPNPYTQYNAPRQNPGQISYTPSAAKKERKPISRGAIAVLCCLMLILSAGAGFGGAMLAARMMQSPYSNESDAPQVSTSGFSSENDPVVIYKSVEEIATSTGTSSSENLTYTQVAAMVKNSVVEIVTEFNNQSMWYQYVTQGAGSGVIISEDGYIITNAHVITDESTGAVADNIIVRLTDATEYTAKPVSYDADSDIAILKIEATGLQPALCGNSDNLAVGEELVVVGNPLGELGGTVTNGIVSATQREIQMGGVTMSLIQTNAAVNPGNSGGGMFNMKGQLVGIVNAKSSGSGIEGLGFAIPINYALEISEQLLEFGYVRGKSMIGVTFQDVSGSNYFFYYNIKSGVYVAELSPGYNDDVLEVGDRIIAVNGSEISSSSDIKAVVSSSSVGDKITFQLYRNDKLMEVEVTCYEKVPDTQSDIQFGTEENTKPQR